MKEYYVYILTNRNRTVLYIGVTNDLKRRLFEHENHLKEGFSDKYNVTYLVYFEIYHSPKEAIAREKQLKGWTRARKEALINSVNPKWRFLNRDVLRIN